MTNPRILVVEDDPVLRLTAKRQLAILGYESVLVGSGEDAVAADFSEIALILMDIGLPGIDGGHATLLIRERELRENRKRVPIIALTAHSSHEKARLAGMDDFLQKPALLEDLRRVLAQWLP